MKTVVITGASSGIGLACVQASLQKGYSVIATARKTEDLAKLADMGAKTVTMELLDENSVTAAATKILELSNGKIDALFNNAGYGQQTALEDSTWQSLTDQHTANVIGPIQLTNQLLPALGKGSKLIFNGSILGLITAAFRGPYSMSKYALEAAVDAYKLELESKGVDVHLIQPGPIDAKFRANALVNLKKTLDGKKTRLDYSNHLARLENSQNTKGTLPASSVADIYIGIITGTHTKTRYLVTNIAKIAALLKRLLGDGFHRFARSSEPANEAD
ncbi:MAG: short-chain dehydrogenase [Moraxellaceae bacterium]|nr:MAG: short-chain dehydrogenase [Moraxellaceae bacterium]